MPVARRRLRFGVVPAVALVLVIAGAQARVGSTTAAVVLANGGSHLPSINADGRFVAFSSYASNPVAGDRNGVADVFVVDRSSGTTERVIGEQSFAQSSSPAISDDGRFVAFETDASNPVGGDNNCRPGPPGHRVCSDVFVHDRETGGTERVNVSSRGGRANAGSGGPSISADGRLIAFWSDASNLVPGDTNRSRDVFIRDRLSGKTIRASVSSAGTQTNGPSDLCRVSADGRFVAFSSESSNLVPGDTNRNPDVFLHDRLSGKTTRVSVSTAGKQASAPSIEPSISADGRFVGFSSEASNLVPGDTNKLTDAFLRDLKTGTTERLSIAIAGAQANAFSRVTAISGDGRYVVFESAATNLAPGATNWCSDGVADYPCPDVFVRNRATRATKLISAGLGKPANGEGKWSAISADGRFVAFDSTASNLVAGDTNHDIDVFLRDLRRGTTTLVSARR